MSERKETTNAPAAAPVGLNASDGQRETPRDESSEASGSPSASESSSRASTHRDADDQGGPGLGRLQRAQAQAGAGAGESPRLAGVGDGGLSAALMGVPSMLALRCFHSLLRNESCFQFHPSTHPYTHSLTHLGEFYIACFTCIPRKY